MPVICATWPGKDLCHSPGPVIHNASSFIKDSCSKYRKGSILELGLNAVFGHGRPGPRHGNTAAPTLLFVSSSSFFAESFVLFDKTALRWLPS